MAKRVAVNNFEDALKILPRYLFAMVDPLGHTTVSDLRFLAQHELDLAAEGELELHPKTRMAILVFLMKTRGAVESL
jgi:hypothetical protein